MYFDLEEAICVSLIVQEDEKIIDDDLDDETNTLIRNAYKNVIETL